MTRYRSVCRKSLSIVLAMLMLITCIPIAASPVVTAVVQSKYEVFNQVSLGPIVYTHGRNYYSHEDWSNNGRYDHMMYGTIIADGSFDGELSTAASSRKTVSKIEVYKENMTLISTANVSISGGKLVGDFGSGLTTPKINSPQKVIFKFTFADGTYEYHKRTVMTNPVAKSTVIGIFGWTFPWTNRRNTAFEVLATGSYGAESESVAPGGSSNYNGIFQYNDDFGNENDHNVRSGNYNFAAMYAPYDSSHVMDVWEKSAVYHIDSLTEDQNTSTDKTPGFYATYGFRKMVDKDIYIKTRNPAKYYLDISTNDNHGINNSGASYQVALMVSNLYHSNREPNNPQSGVNQITSSSAVNGVSLNTSTARTLSADSQTTYNLMLQGTAVAGETIKATVEVRHGDKSWNTVYAGIFTDIEIYVTDKSEAREEYSRILGFLEGMREQCYTAESWKNMHDAALALESWLSDNTNTTSGTTLLNNFKDAFQNLKKTDDQSSHDMQPVSARPASCTEPSTESYKCSLCDYVVETHETEALGHDYGNEVTILSTCTGRGYVRQTCSRCGDVKVKDGSYKDPTGHSYVVVNEYPATCELRGSKQYKCSACGDSYTETIDPLGHDYQLVETVAATCSKEGTKYYVCSHDANHNYTEPIEKIPHTVVVDEAKEATCQEDGLTEGSHCSVCDEILVAQTKVAGVHKFEDYKSNNYATCAKDGTMTAECKYGCGAKRTITDVGSKDNIDHTPAEAVKENEVEATCVDAGSYDSVVYCSVCDKEIGRETVEVPATGKHTYVSKTENATCTVPGKVTFTCSVCGDTYTEDGALADHVLYTTKEAIAPSCTTDGQTAERTCVVCGEVIIESEVVSSTGHKIREVASTPATCTEAGNKAYSICTVCGLITIDGAESSIDDTVIPASGHTEKVLSEAVEATCTTEGATKSSICSVCGETLSEKEIIPALGHSYETKEAGKAATCTEDGKTAVEKCKVCDNEIGGEVIPATGHKAKRVPGTPATCTSEGLTDGSVCWNCGETLVEQQTIEKLEHKMSNYVVTKPATCTEEGERQSKCSLCGETVTQSIPKLKHSFSVLISEKVEPTCTSDGKTAVYGCENCDQTSGGESIEKLGHDYVHKTKEATCTEDGFEKDVCSRCGDEINVVIKDVPGHDPAEAIKRVTKVATCTQTGLYVEEVFCNRCKERLSISEEKVIEMIDHDYGEEQTYESAATCVDKGEKYSYKVCKVCGNREIIGDIVYTDALNHLIDLNDTEKTTITKEPTCTEKGLATVICARCNETIENYEVPAKGHTPAEAVEENVVAIDGNCANGGSYEEVVYCSVCDEVLSRETKTFESRDHVAGEVQIVEGIEPTCTEDGYHYEVVKCVVCGTEISNDKITDDKLGHDFDESIKDNVTYFAATCTKEAYKTIKCSRCDEVKTVEGLGPVVPHTNSAAVRENIKPATCKNEGSYDSVIYCAVCKTELSRKTVKIPVVDHKEGEPEEIIITPATCTSEGLAKIVIKCVYCEEVLSEETKTIPALPHHDDDGDGRCDDCNWVIGCKHENIIVINEKPADCKNPGYSGDKVCEVCGEAYTVEVGHVIAKGPHRIVVDEAVAPTCQQTGLTAGSHCEVCGTVFDAQRSVPTIEHIQVTVPGVKATCANPGTSDATVCAMCGLIITPHKIINVTTDHVDADGDGICDVCHQTISAICSCVCHKTSFIGKLTYKFVRIFWKLFGIGKSCACGNVHY